MGWLVMGMRNKGRSRPCDEGFSTRSKMGPIEQQAERLEHSNQGHGQHRRQDVQPIRLEVSEEAVQLAHSLRRVQRCGIRDDRAIDKLERKP